MDPTSITKAYQENIGQHPGRDIAFLAGTGAVGAYAAAPLLIKLLTGALSIGGGPQVQQAADRYLNEGGAAKARRRLALAAGAVGALYGVYKHHIPKPAPVVPETPASRRAEASSMGKEAASDYYRENIPVVEGIRAVNSDPLLLNRNKQKVNQLLSSSANDGRTTSGFNMTNAALAAGVDFGTAFVFGQGMGKLLSMPAPLVNRLSTTGGVAAAVVGSGILRKL
jgi:hypothetical protein